MFKTLRLACILSLNVLFFGCNQGQSIPRPLDDSIAHDGKGRFDESKESSRNEAKRLIVIAVVSTFQQEALKNAIKKLSDNGIEFSCVGSRELEILVEKSAAKAASQAIAEGLATGELEVVTLVPMSDGKNEID